MGGLFPSSPSYCRALEYSHSRMIITSGRGHLHNAGGVPQVACFGTRGVRGRLRGEEALVHCGEVLLPIFQGRKNSIGHKLFGPDFPRTFPTLTPGRPWVKKFLPSPGPQKNALFGADVHDFRRGRP